MIVVAHDLSPADMILFKQHAFAGFVTDVGGVTSHTAIVARSLGLPAIVGLHHARQMIRENELLIIDGNEGVLIVNPDFPAKTTQELIEIAKRKPGSVNYGSVGVGSSTHLQAEMFKRAAGIDIVNITYKGSAPALQDLAAGQVQMMFASAGAVGPHVRSGRLRALGVSSDQRSQALPDVPTLAESGVNITIPQTWWAVLMPKATPPVIINRLNGDIAAILKLPDIIARITQDGGMVETSADGAETFEIPSRPAQPGPLQSSWAPGPIANSTYTAAEMAQITAPVPSEDLRKADRMGYRVDDIRVVESGLRIHLEPRN